MKKNLKVLVSVLLVVSLIFCFAIQSFAFEYSFDSMASSYYYNENIASAYFAHNEAFSLNENGSCTFVSIQLLLSYYDSFWSDSFVPEAYEVAGAIGLPREAAVFDTSPGVQSEDYMSAHTHCADYDEYIENHKNEFFQLYLMDLAKDEGLIKGLDPVYMLLHPNDDNGDYSLWDPEMVELLEVYLYDVIGLTEQQVTVHSMIYSLLNFNYSEEAVREKLIELVSSGTPVIYTGWKTEPDDEVVESSGLDKTGHAMIAYDYNPETDNVYYHMGWHRADARLANDTDNPYDYYPSLIWLEINEEAFPHECSDNYRIKNTADRMCLCRLDIHPAHNHSFSYIEHDSSSHTQVCDECHESFVNSHSLTYKKINGVQHSITCACGYENVGVHIVKGMSETCVLCRAAVDNGYITLGFRGQAASVNSVYNNVTHLSDSGIIVLSDEDYIAFINGNLTVEELYERLGLVYD